MPPPKDPAHLAPPKPKTLPIELLRPSPRNRRTVVDDEFVASVKQHGVIERLVVREMPADPDDGAEYEIVCGHRRWFAAKKAEIADVPVDVRDLDDAGALEVAIIENLHRQSLTPLEEADAFRWLVEEKGRSVADVAARVARSESYVRQRLHLHGLIDALRDEVASDGLTMDAALLVAQTPEDVQKEIAERIGEVRRSENLREDLVRIGRAEVADWLHGHWNQLREAPFDIGDAMLVETAGACGTCPKRTGTQGVLFDTVAVADACLDKSCFGSKVDANFENKATDAKKRGLRVLTDKEMKDIAPAGSVMRGGDWVDLEARAYDDGSIDAPKWREVLEEADVPRAIGKLPMSGRVVEVVERRSALAIATKTAKESGDKKLGKSARAEVTADKTRAQLKQQEKDRKADAAEASRKAAAELEKKLVEVVARAEEARDGFGREALVRRILATFALAVWGDAPQRLVKRRGIDDSDGTGGKISGGEALVRWTTTGVSVSAMLGALAELGILAHDRTHGDARPDFVADLAPHTLKPVVRKAGDANDGGAVKPPKKLPAPKRNWKGSAPKKKPGKLTNAATKSARSKKAAKR